MAASAAAAWRRCRSLAALLKDVIGRRLFTRHVFGFGERNGSQLLAPQDTKCVIPHDAAQPAGERRRLGKGRQRRPGGDKGFLDDVLGLLEIAHLGQRRPEGELLEAPGQLHEGPDIAFNRHPDQPFVIHCHNPFTSKVPGRAVYL
jgi:hypothetical protein